jgi:hypothetical protein
MEPSRQGQQQQQQQQLPRPQARPHSKSGFSFRSDKSGSDSKSHKRKESLLETTAEKRKTHMSSTTKANPNAALNEAQPSKTRRLPRATFRTLTLLFPSCGGIGGIHPQQPLEYPMQ